MKRTNQIDRFALQRDKEMTPGARLDWLAAAVDFVHKIDAVQGRKVGSKQE